MNTRPWTVAAELGDWEDAYPQKGRCWCDDEMPWTLTRYPTEGQGAADWCPKCGAPWFKL